MINNYQQFTPPNLQQNTKNVPLELPTSRIDTDVHTKRHQLFNKTQQAHDTNSQQAGTNVSKRLSISISTT